VPIKREGWTARFEEISREAAGRMAEMQFMMMDNDDVYRQHFRAPKR
jgi:hypothetical protein